MPRTENSQPGQPQEGNIQLIVVRPLNNFPALYLEIPIHYLDSVSECPRKYLRYLGWCIMGVEGHVARDSPQPEDNIGDEGGIEAGAVYSYRIPEGLSFSSALASFLTFHKDIDDDDILQHAIHMDVIDARSTPSRYATHSQVAEDRQLERFREDLEQRDVCCIVTGSTVYRASHIIAYAHENAVS
jgi:hypothetical protein